MGESTGRHTVATRTQLGPAPAASSDGAFGESELFEHAFENAPIGMALVATDGRWLKVNDALCRIVGYTRSELLASDFQSITHADDLASDLREVTRLLKGEIGAYELEKRYIRKDGSIVWILLSVSLVRRDDGSPRFFISQIQDISRRKRAESDIARFFATSKDMLAIAGTAGKLELVSPAWERTLGWSAHELTSRDFLEFVHPDDRANTIAEAELVYAGAPSDSFRNRYRSKSGAYHWLEWNTSVAERGRLFCVVRDVTARMEEERARAWLAAIVENASDAIIGVDADGCIFSWNGGAQRLYGYQAQEMMGRHISCLGPDEAARAAIVGVWQSALSGVKHQEYDARRARRDGSVVDVQVQVRAVEAGGSVLGWSVTARDISERKELAEALARQVQMYEATARSLPKGAITVFDRTLHFVAADGELLAQLGIAPGALVGKHVAEATSSSNREALEAVYQRALAGESTEIEAERNGRTLLIRVAPLHDAAGATGGGGLVLSLDISAQKREAEQLRRTKLLLEATIANIQDGVVLLDADRRCLIANEAFTSMFGLDRTTVVGLGRDEFSELVAPQFADPEHFRARMRGDGAQIRTLDDFVQITPRRRVLRASLKRVGGGGEAGYLAVWRDITMDSDLLAQRDREALSDALTGIPNRRAAEAALQGACARALAAGSPLSVAMFDVDYFKRVNDLHGHAVGDMVLQAVANALSGQARQGDVVARWGGEEFIVILPVAREGALACCERMRQAVRQLQLRGLGTITISAGVASASRCADPAQLVAQADERLYEAKAAGRDRVLG